MIGRIQCHVLPVNFDRPRCGHLKSCQYPQQCRLATTGWSQQRKEFAFHNIKVGVVHCTDATEILDDILD